MGSALSLYCRFVGGTFFNKAVYSQLTCFKIARNKLHVAASRLRSLRGVKKARFWWWRSEVAHNHFLHCSTDFIAFYFNKKIKTDRRQMFFFLFLLKFILTIKSAKWTKWRRRASWVSQSPSCLLNHTACCASTSPRWKQNGLWRSADFHLWWRLLSIRFFKVWVQIFGGVWCPPRLIFILHSIPVHSLSLVVWTCRAICRRVKWLVLPIFTKCSVGRRRLFKSYLWDLFP